MKKLLTIILLLSITLSAQAQDIGVTDTIKFVGDTLVIGQSIPIEVVIINDQPIQGMLNGFTVASVDSGYAKFDSVIFINRMSDPTVIDFRMARSEGNNANGPDTIRFGGYTLSGNDLPAGNDAVCLFYFTGVRSGTMEIDSLFIPPTYDFDFIDGNSNKFIPSFTTKQITVKNGTALPTLTISDTLVQAATNDEIAFDINSDSDVSISNFTKFDSDETPVSQPTLTDESPYHFSWSPSSSDIGIWEITFQACDSQNNCVEKNIILQIVESDKYLVDYSVFQNPTSTRPLELKCVDVDNDGFVEIAIAGYPHFNNESFVLYTIDPLTNILSQDFFVIEPYSMTGLQFGYLNSDDYLDFIVDRSLQTEADIYYNNSNKTFTLSSNESITLNRSNVKDAVLSEFNNDQFLDG